MSAVTQRLSLCVWRVSLSTVSSASLRGAAGAHIPVLFKAEKYSCVCATALCSSVHRAGTFGSFQSLAVVSDAAVNRRVRISESLLPALLGLCPGVESLDRIVTQRLTS